MCWGSFDGQWIEKRSVFLVSIITGFFKPVMNFPSPRMHMEGCNCSRSGTSSARAGPGGSWWLCPRRRRRTRWRQCRRCCWLWGKRNGFLCDLMFRKLVIDFTWDKHSENLIDDRSHRCFNENNLQWIQHCSYSGTTVLRQSIRLLADVLIGVVDPGVADEERPVAVDAHARVVQVHTVGVLYKKFRDKCDFLYFFSSMIKLANVWKIHLLLNLNLNHQFVCTWKGFYLLWWCDVSRLRMPLV